MDYDTTWKNPGLTGLIRAPRDSPKMVGLTRDPTFFRAKICGAKKWFTGDVDSIGLTGAQKVSLKIIRVHWGSKITELNRAHQKKTSRAKRAH